MGLDKETFILAGVEPPLPDNDTVWAEIDGDQLVVYLVSAGANPAESVSRYRRTVPDNRMTFGYTVTRGGEIVDSVTGTLIKAKVVL